MISNHFRVELDSEKMLTIARRCIDVEATTLMALNRALGPSFVEALALIHTSTGRVICTGMGKSSLIAQKIVATFNSTGTPAIFMHAGDAMHGDLGMMQRNDVVLCLSKSGETEELKKIIPLIKERGNPIVGIVGKENCYLAERSNTIILTPVHQEAEPNDLAPTASSMAQLAVGDALAACLIVLKDFQPSDFANLHPGGMLGKRLLLTVSDLIDQKNPPAVKLAETMKDVIFEISSKRLGATAVMNTENQVAGIITDGDIRRMLEKSQDWSRLRAHDIMSKAPKSIDHRALALDALGIMQKFNITQLLVMAGDQYVGMIHIHDLLKVGLA